MNVNNNKNNNQLKQEKPSFNLLKIQGGKINVLYLGIVAIVAAIVGAAIFSLSSNQPEFFSYVFKKRQKQPAVEKNVEKLPRQNLPQGVTMVKPDTNDALPQGFPDIPLNGKKNITNAYTLNYDGQQGNQKVVDFVSSQSVKENFDFYKNWVTKNKWNVLYELNNVDKAAIVAMKNRDSLNVSIVKDAADQNISKVNISF